MPTATATRERLTSAATQEHGMWVNHKKVLRLMQEMNLRSRIRRKHRCNYSSPTEGRVAENRLKRNFAAYQMSLRNDNQLVLETFAKAFEKTKDVSGYIVHSDQGFQYTSYAYYDMLPKVGAQISMSLEFRSWDEA